MDKAKEIITRKIGPLPLWAWVAAGAAALFLFTRIRGGGAASSGPSATPADVSAPQALDFQQSLLDLASSLRQPAQSISAPSNSGPVPVVPTSETPSITPSPVSVPSGGTVAATKPIIGGLPLDLIPGLTRTDTGYVFPQGPGHGAISLKQKLLGFSDPVTGNLETSPGPGRIPVFG